MRLVTEAARWRRRRFRRLAVHYRVKSWAVMAIRREILRDLLDELIANGKLTLPNIGSITMQLRPPRKWRAVVVGQIGGEGMRGEVRRGWRFVVRFQPSQFLRRILAASEAAEYLPQGCTTLDRWRRTQLEGALRDRMIRVARLRFYLKTRNGRRSFVRTRTESSDGGGDTSSQSSEQREEGRVVS